MQCILLFAMNALNFLSFFLFFFDYVIALLFCVEQWVASIDGRECTLLAVVLCYQVIVLLLCICGYR